jgi:4-hydroxybenzoyl-CoA thioesterase
VNLTTANTQIIAPYAVKRTVSWGDCDPAGIIYTPRALDYGAETLEAWVRDILGTTWREMNTVTGFGMPTVRAEIDYVGVLHVDQHVSCELRVEKLGETSLVTRTTAHDEAGTEFFHVTIVSVLVAKPNFEPTSWPPEFRSRIEAFVAAGADLQRND